MPAYTVHLCDALTDDVIAELPAESLTYGEVLNAPGAATVTMALDAKAYGVEEIAPLRQSLFVLRDDVPVWGGIVWSAAMYVGANTLTLNAQGFWSLMRRRRINGDLIFNGTDQALIAKGIVDNVQGVAHGDLLIDTSQITAVGVTRDRSYWDWEKKNAGEAVEQLAAVRDGFDFAIRPARVNGAYVRQMTVSYPATGRVSNIMLEVGTNVAIVAATVDASTMALRVHAKGEGDGILAVQTVQDNAALLGVYPLVEDLIVHNDVSNEASLIAHALRRLDAGRVPVTIPRLTIPGGVEPTIGEFIVGDQVRVRVDYGLLSIDATYRITEWKVAVNEDGREEIDLSLAPLEVFTSA
jgi:hypothetical protein